MDHERFWRCDCGADHFVSFHRLDWGDHRQHYISIVDTERAARLSLWPRFKAALKLAWGRNHNWTEVILTEESAREMMIELETAVDQMRADRLFGDDDESGDVQPCPTTTRAQKGELANVRLC